MIPWILWIALRLFVFVSRKPRCTFTDPETGAPYMTRWWLGKRSAWPDATGRTGGKGWYLHCFHRSDWSRDLHCHPAQLGVSYVLHAGYFELRREGKEGDLQHKSYHPGKLNVLHEDTFHRVILRTDDADKHEIPAWTLFYIGPRSGRSWGFLRNDGSINQAAHFDGRTGEVVDR